MDINLFDLSGGINQGSTKTELGYNTKKLYWTDSKNIEIYDNKGIIRQKGNSLVVELPEAESITGLAEMESDSSYKLIITTISGKIYIYSEVNNSLTLLEKTLVGKNIIFAPFLRGIVIATEADTMFYIKDNSTFDIADCNLKDLGGNTLYPDCVTVYKGRIWCAKDSTIYYSALGMYNDFQSSDDAGYINDFHTDTADIIAMNTYKDYLAIYKKERVYLLTGSNPTDFAISLFADKGTEAKKSIINVDNKQYFLSNGIYALEQVGELNQIRLGSEISLNIKDEFGSFDRARLKDVYAVHYQKNNQMWYFFPYLNDDYNHTIWINDYVNRSWYKRVVPQNITSACIFHSNVYTADDTGKVFREDYGTSFDGVPISFMWKSPFLALGNILHRKLIDEFYFVLDDMNDNKFKFSIYKDYDSRYSEDSELIYSRHFNHLMWADDNSPDEPEYCWTPDNSETPVWSISSDLMEKAEICGSNYAVQLCVEGSEPDDNCAIIGLQFREIYNDD
ncbi:MAG: hypothetical protein ACI37Q_05270 [Candidatus Gastranaerophilaceae bacterium]